MMTSNLTAFEYYGKFLNQYSEGTVIDALKRDFERQLAFLRTIPIQKFHYRYAEGKWSVAQVLQHVIDCERVYQYRALCIARGESTALPGFDENAYAEVPDYTKMNLANMIREFDVIRNSGILMFQSFSDADLERKGIANNIEFTPDQIGRILAGHATHHFNVLKERYLI